MHAINGYKRWTIKVSRAYERIPVIGPIYRPLTRSYEKRFWTTTIVMTAVTLAVQYGPTIYWRYQERKVLDDLESRRRMYDALNEIPGIKVSP